MTGRSASVLVVGAGPGGFAAARVLHHAGVRVRMFAPDGRVAFLPGTLDVVLGAAGPERFVHPVTLPGAAVDGRTVEAVRGDGVRVDGRWEPADAVIAAPGLAPRPVVPAAVAGAVAFWDTAGAAAAARAVAATAGGTVAVVVAGLPYRCPPAPFGLAMRLAAAGRRPGRMPRVVVTTPEQRPLAALGEVPGAFLLDACARAGVQVRTGVVPDPDALARGLLRTGTGAIDADLLLVVPPHGPRPVLADHVADGPLVPVAADHATAVPGLYVVGDAAAVPYPKAAEPAAAGGALAARAVLARLGLGEPPEPTPPKAECYVGHGGGSYSRLRLDYPDGPPPAGAAHVVVDGPSVELGAAFHAAHDRFRTERAG